MKWFIFLLMIAGFFACAGNNSGLEERPMSARQINRIVAESGAVAMTVEVQTPNPCWKFSRYTVDERDGNYLVTVYAEKDPEEICAQMLGSFVTEVKIPDLKAGECEIRVWCNQTEHLDTTVVVQ